MYHIIDRKSLREEDGFRIEVDLQPGQSIMVVYCQYPSHRRMTFDLLSKGSGSLIGRRYYTGGSTLHIDLNPFSADAFEFRASDETGKTVVVYQIMRVQKSTVVH